MALLITPPAPTKSEPRSRVWTDWFVKVVALLTNTINTLTQTAALTTQTANMAIPIVSSAIITNPFGEGSPYEITTASFNMPQAGKLLINFNILQNNTSVTTDDWHLDIYIDGAGPVFSLSGTNLQETVSYTTSYDVSAGDHTVKLKWTTTPVGALYDMVLIVTRSIS